MDNSSGVGVLDKAALVLTALESGPATLAGLVAGTGLARPTAHRLAVALEHHRLVARDMQGRFVLGPRLSELSADPETSLADLASALREAQALRPQLDELDEILGALQERAREARRSWVTYASSPSTSSISEA